MTPITKLDAALQNGTITQDMYDKARSRLESFALVGELGEIARAKCISLSREGKVATVEVEVRFPATIRIDLSTWDVEVFTGNAIDDGE